MEKPILLNTEEVKAILDGRKTMTRRVINAPVFKQVRDPNKIYWKNDQVIFQWHGDTIWEVAIKPPCQPGDILWVKETFAVGKIAYGEEPDGREVAYISQCQGENDSIPKEWAISNDIGIEDVVWSPSIHMPREAARLFLKVKDVRVERLQDITEEDAEKEGVKAYGPNNCSGTSARIAFAELWDSTIKKQDIDRYGWAANPWVWVIEFERVEV